MAWIQQMKLTSNLDTAKFNRHSPRRKHNDIVASEPQSKFSSFQSASRLWNNTGLPSGATGLSSCRAARLPAFRICTISRRPSAGIPTGWSGTTTSTLSTTTGCTQLSAASGRASRSRRYHHPDLSTDH